MVKDHIKRGDYTNKIAPKLVFSILRLAEPLVGILLLINFVEKFEKLPDVLENTPSVVNLYSDISAEAITLGLGP